jgi:hypothetical protein
VRIPRHSEVYGRVYSEARNGNGMKKIVKKNPTPANRIDSMFSSETYCTPSCCLFREMIWNRIPSVCLYFCSMERNSELFSLPQNGSERNSERLLLILFHDTEFRAFFSSPERFGTEFREFSVPRNSRNSAGTNQLFRLFRLPRNNFFGGNCQP